MIAERLRHSVAEADAVGRVGADCFAVIAQDVNEEADVPHFIEQTILPGLAAPFLVEGQELRVGVRIGVSFYPNDGSDPERLLKNAEAAAISMTAKSDFVNRGGRHQSREFRFRHRTENWSFQPSTK